MPMLARANMTNPLPFGQFTFDFVGETLGIGGLGRVDKIRIVSSNAIGLPVGAFRACKRLNAKWNQHPEVRERFEREIRALRHMSHTNIVTCQGENLPGGERFYIMPVFSSSLRTFIAGASHQGDWRFFAEHGAILASALQYAHGRGFFHRDFKPENVLFNPGEPLVVADWGLGYFVHRESVVLQQLTRGGMGTEYYCSAEQWNTGKCDGRGDIYSLGMTLDECVTGYQRTIAVGTGVNGPATNERSHGADRFNALLRAMTQPQVKNRPLNMAAVAMELRALASSPRPTTLV
jgi:serine/threonine protein kinase